MINLSENLNPYLKWDHIYIRNDLSYTYPLPYAESSSAALANVLMISPDNVLMTNGSMDGINMVVSLFKSVGTIPPTFWGYKNCVDRLKKRLERIYSGVNDPLYYKKIDSLSSRVSLMIICNPNNPTGNILNLNQIESLVNKHKKTTFLIDEAMLPFTISYPNNSAINLCKKFDNLIVVMSLSKVLNCPGLRIGALITNSELIKKIKLMKAPYTILNTFSASFLKQCMKYFPLSVGIRRKIESNFCQLDELLSDYCDYQSGSGVGFRTYHIVNKYYNSLIKSLHQGDISVRELVDSYPCIGKNWIRVSAMNEKELNKVKSVIKGKKLL